MATAKQKDAAKKAAATRKRNVAAAEQEQPPTVAPIPVREPDPEPEVLAVDEFEKPEVMAVEAFEEGGDYVDIPEDIHEIGDELSTQDYDQSLVVIIIEANFVYRSKTVATGLKILLAKEGHYDPSKMKWAFRSERAKRTRKRFKQRATKGSYRDAMQQVAIANTGTEGGGRQGEPLA